jgi:hypothetical protein
MIWHVTAGVAQLALIALFLATQVRARRRSPGEVLLYAVPMTGLAVGTLVGAGRADLGCGRRGRGATGRMRTW